MAEGGWVLVTLALIHLGAVVSPGPSFVVIARTAVAESRGAGVWLALGLGVGTLIWAVAALFGLSLLFAVAPWLYTGLRLAGALFLLWLAWQLWRHADAPLVFTAAARPAMRPLEALHRGIAVQLANPKVAVFFGSVFAGLVPPDAGLGLLAAVLLIVFVNEFGWYALVAILLAQGRVQARYAAAKGWIDRASGGILALIGARLAAAG